jgi:hypothetical protein
MAVLLATRDKPLRSAVKTKILLVLLVAAILLLLARVLRPVSKPLGSLPTNGAVEISNSASNQPSSSGVATSGQSSGVKAEKQNVPKAQGNSANQSSAPTSLSEQLENVARQRGVSLSTLTQQIAAEFSNGLAQELNRPLDFYGRVVDEREAPLSGANAALYCRIFPDRQFPTNLLTDANGVFTLQGVLGQALTIRITKEGYEETPGTNENHFIYGGVANGFQPDFNNPVIFRLRRRGAN